MDVEDALHRLDHDQDLLREIVLIYVEDSPGMLTTIQRAVEQGDASSLQRAAHSLKGLAATLSARDTANAAYRLEQLGASGNLTEAKPALTALEQRLTELNESVDAFLHRR
jgi:HPt (histidine-containing phosphotransfer) domain-containing protein